MIVQGYKSFDINGTNIKGKVFLPNQIYHCDGPIKFGPYGNGYHFAKNMEDTIRYSNYGNILREVKIAEVIGFGEIDTGSDEYNGYYDLFVASELKIVKYLTRNEIISLALSLSEFRMERFVSLFKLSPDEIPLFENKSLQVDLALDYYQRNIKEAYQKSYYYKKFYINEK